MLVAASVVLISPSIPPARAAATQSDYWLVGGDGAVFPFGTAANHGSLAGQTLAKPVVGAARTPAGKGYWLVASDGGIFAFGDAAFHGSTGAIRLAQPIVGMASTVGGKGWRYTRKQWNQRGAPRLDPELLGDRSGETGDARFRLKVEPRGMVNGRPRRCGVAVRGLPHTNFLDAGSQCRRWNSSRGSRRSSPRIATTLTSSARSRPFVSADSAAV